MVPAILIVITIHEFSHALMAFRLGDPTAKALGRLSLNPIRHLDPVGTLLIVMTMLSGFGIGWGKPVPVDPRYLKPNPKSGMALVSAAGPLSNVLTAFVLYLPERLQPGFYANDQVWLLVQFVILWSVGLGTFNLLPLPPLDGFSVLLGLLPNRAAYSFSRLAQYGLGPLFVLIMADSFLHLGILAAILGPVQNVIFTFVTGGSFF